MMFYGNEFRTLSGVIREVQERMVKVEFSVYANEKIVTVPKNLINSSIILKPGLKQEFKIPLWFLKRNRIVPLNDNLT
ncbi:MAG: hypothetical protein ACTSWY_04545 [Promethearchaeota archaeon]